MEVLLCLAILLLLIEIKILEYKMEKENEANLRAISSIFTFLHKQYGITVAEVRKNYDSYKRKEIDYLGKAE